MKFEKALLKVTEEYNRASDQNPAFNSAHEGIAVLMEELDELKAEVWKKGRERDRARMRKEAQQVAAMAIRFMVDLL